MKLHSPQVTNKSGHFLILARIIDQKVLKTKFPTETYRSLKSEVNFSEFPTSYFGVQNTDQATEKNLVANYQYMY